MTLRGAAASAAGAQVGAGLFGPRAPGDDDAVDDAEDDAGQASAPGDLGLPAHAGDLPAHRPLVPAPAVRAVQGAGLVAAAVAVLPGTAAARPALAALAALLVLLGDAALFAEAARRDALRRSAARAWALLAAGHAGLAVTVAAWVLAGGGTPGPVTAAACGVCAVLVAAAAWLQVPGRGSRWPTRGWLGAGVVALGAAAAGTAAFTAAAAAGPDRDGAAAGTALLGAVLLVAVLGSLSLTVPRPRPRLRRLAEGLAVVVLADVAALALTGAGAVFAPERQDAAARAAFLIALGGHALAGLAATDLSGGRRADRRRRSADATTLTLPGTATLAAFVVAALALALPDVPRAAGALGLAALALALGRSAFALHSTRADDRGDPRPRTDDLTGLANRRALSEALAGDGRAHDADAGWSGWAGWADEIALLLVDIDRFKEVNVAFGHEAGDRLLAALGARLRTALRPTQLLARLGGDEFAVVLPAAGEEQARRVAEALRGSLREPFLVDGEKLHVQASVGIATCHPARGEPTDLLRQADVAMYAAKEAGGGIQVYDPAGDRQGGARLRRIEELREALERGDLEVHIQPQVDLKTRVVTGAEALARWRHPVDGVLLPDSFLPLAEQTGLMKPVAALVLDRALAACATWWRLGHEVPVSVNLGADDLRDPDLPGVVSKALETHGLPPEALRVEITEQALLTDPKSASALLERWRDDGVSVAIDDFGTGYSSLSYLRELPVDEVKLDRAFVADISRGTTSTIVRHTVAMAHGLWARVVAEGIEDEQTALTLAELGCDVGQGLHFGPAMRTAEFVELLGREVDHETPEWLG